MSINYEYKECSVCHQQFLVSPDLLEDLSSDAGDELVCQGCYELEEIEN
jgi:hypothetical protein